MMEENKLEDKFEEALEKSAQLIEQTMPVIVERCESILDRFITWLDSKIT